MRRRTAHAENRTFDRSGRICTRFRVGFLDAQSFDLHLMTAFRQALKRSVMRAAGQRPRLLGSVEVMCSGEWGLLAASHCNAWPRLAPRGVLRTN